MVTRRAFLVGTATLAGLAGCRATRQSNGSQTVCAASVSGAGSDSVFSLTPTVRSFGTGATPVAELVVPIRQAVVESQTVRQLVVFAGQEVRYRLPVRPDDEPVGATTRYEADDVVEYAQSLGHVPQTGAYRVEALNGDGESIDETRIEFRCYRVVDEGAD